VRPRGTRHAVGASPLDARRHNRPLVLRSIWEGDGVSRAELSRLTRLSGPVITDIVGELLAAGLIREDGQKVSTGGRRATILRMDEQARHVVAVDLARHQTRVAITDLNATVLHQVSVPTSGFLDPRANLRWLQGIISRAINDYGLPRERLLGIGVGAPGPLSTTTGEILAPTNFGAWQRISLRSALEQAFKVTVRVDNDANACALALRMFGPGRTARDFVYLAAGSGVGAGIVIDGEVYRGGHDLAGEIGHATVEPDGPHCPCGNVGCLELYTTVRATLARAMRTLPPATALDELSAIRALIESAHAGNEDAQNALATTARYLAIAAVNAINAFDPHVVFIGRELAAADELILGPVRAVVAERAFTATGRKVPIERDPLGDDTPLLGAASLVLRELFLDTDILGDLMVSSRPVDSNSS